MLCPSIHAVKDSAAWPFQVISAPGGPSFLRFQVATHRRHEAERVSEVAGRRQPAYRGEVPEQRQFDVGERGCGRKLRFGRASCVRAAMRQATTALTATARSMRPPVRWATVSTLHPDFRILCQSSIRHLRP